MAEVRVLREITISKIISNAKEKAHMTDARETSTSFYRNNRNFHKLLNSFRPYIY